MCVICQFAPGYTPPYNLICNAVNNNPDGYGLVVKKGKKLEVIKELPEGGNDPETIYRLLKDNEKYERFLHVRWKTQGEVSFANTQPFTVLETKNRRIEFMHNGTMHNYTSTYRVGAQDPDSDSLKFADQVLRKYLPKVIGDNGIGDIEDDDIRGLLDKYWSVGNRGILICNDLDPYFFNLTSWETVKTSEVVDGQEVTGQFFASNNEYFERLKRGPLFVRLEEARKKREEEERQARVVSTRTGQSVSAEINVPQISFPGFSTRYGITEGISDLLEDYDMFTPEGYIALANLTYYEMLKMVESTEADDVTSLLLYLTHFLKINTENLNEVIKKNASAVEKINSLSEENKKLSGFIQEKRSAA